MQAASQAARQCKRCLQTQRALYRVDQVATAASGQLKRKLQDPKRRQDAGSGVRVTTARSACSASIMLAKQTDISLTWTAVIVSWWLLQLRLSRWRNP